MRSLRGATLLALLLTACGSPAPISGGEAPGAARSAPSISAALPSTSEAPVSGEPTTSTSTVAPPSSLSTTTIVTPATTTPEATTTALPTTTAAPAPTSTVAPAPTTSPPPVYVAEPADGTLNPGVEGPRSLQLQRDLIALTFLPAGADDGQYGPGTAGGVRRFQEANALVVDGVAGPNTLAAITTAIADQNGDA